jgi:hypothetical protein
LQTLAKQGNVVVRKLAQTPPPQARSALVVRYEKQCWTKKFWINKHGPRHKCGKLALKVLRNVRRKPSRIKWAAEYLRRWALGNLGKLERERQLTLRARAVSLV